LLFLNIGTVSFLLKNELILEIVRIPLIYKVQPRKAMGEIG
jgi:hypothetical protein